MKSKKPKITFLHSKQSTFRGSLKIFREKTYLGIAFVSALIVFYFYLALPVWLVPGNSFGFELSLFSPLNYLLLGVLALMTGILISFEIFAFRRSRKHRLHGVGKSGVGFVAAITGGILAAASCGCGIGILLGVVGLGGGALFVAAHQEAIIIIMMLVVLVGLYFSARRAAGMCSTCQA